MSQSDALNEALVVLGEMHEVADTEGMEDDTVIPVWPSDVAYDFAPFKVKHVRAIMRFCTAALRAAPPTTAAPVSATPAIELLREWREVYAGSTDKRGKPCTPELEQRTDELLRGVDRTTKNADS